MTSRSVPSSALTSLNRQEIDDYVAVFLTINHDILSQPVRVVSDPVDHVLDSNTYAGFQFDVTILSDNDRAPEARLRVQNVDQRINQALLAALDPPELTIEVISSDQFNTGVDPRTEVSSGASQRLYTAQHLQLVNVTGDSLFIEGTLITWNYSQELFPGLMATKARLPGLFR